MKRLTTIIGNSTLHKILGLIAAGLAIYGGPGVATNETKFVAALGAGYAALIHLIDSVWNSPKSSNPVQIN